MLHRISTGFAAGCFVTLAVAFAACAAGGAGGEDDGGSAKGGLESAADDYCDELCDCAEDACPETDDDNECADALVEGLDALEGSKDVVDCQKKAYVDYLECVVDNGSCEPAEGGGYGGGGYGGGDGDGDGDDTGIGWVLVDDGCTSDFVEQFTRCYDQGSGGDGGASSSGPSGPSTGPGPVTAVTATSVSAGPVTVAASSSAGGSCSGADESCTSNECCAGHTCVGFDNGDFCQANCSAGSDCASGCCVGFANGEGFCVSGDYCTGGVCDSGITLGDPETDACLTGFCCAQAQSCTSNGSDTDSCIECANDGGGALCDDLIECSSQAGCL